MAQLESTTSMGMGELNVRMACWTATDGCPRVVITMTARVPAASTAGASFG
jgi:hypothetical protein